jgi:anti-anti-sigma regulatory factor
MQISQQRIALSLLSFMTAGTILVLIIQLATQARLVEIMGTGVATLIFASLMFVYWRGWNYAGEATIVILTLLVTLTTPEKYVTQEISITVCIPPILAMILGRPAWVVGSGIAIPLIMLMRAGWHGVYTDPLGLALYTMIIGGLLLSRLATGNINRLAEANTRAEEALAQAAQQRLELARRAEELEQRNEQQQRLLDLVATLEMPTVPLAAGVLFAPIVGYIDSQRGQTLTTRLLQAASTQRARLVVLDISGVPVMDMTAARGLLQTTQALRLLGCEVAISGISAAVATTLSQIDISLASVTTVRSPQEILAQYLFARPNPMARG